MLIGMAILKCSKERQDFVIVVVAALVLSVVVVVVVVAVLVLSNVVVFVIVVLFGVVGLVVVLSKVRSGIEDIVMGIVVLHRSLKNRCATEYRIGYKGD